MMNFKYFCPGCCCPAYTGEPSCTLGVYVHVFPLRSWWLASLLPSPSASPVQMFGQVYSEQQCLQHRRKLVWGVSWPVRIAFWLQRASWKRRRKISSSLHGCPSQGTAVRVVFQISLGFFLNVCHWHLAFVLSHFERGSRRRNTRWLVRYRGRRLGMLIRRAVLPTVCLKVFSYMSTWYKPAHRTTLSTGRERRTNSAGAIPFPNINGTEMLFKWHCTIQLRAFPARQKYISRLMVALMSVGSLVSAILPLGLSEVVGAIEGVFV